MKIVVFTCRVIIFSVLTIITQIGGIIYLLSFTTHKFINKKFHQRAVRLLIKFFSFIILYLIATFAIVPLLARPFGRVPLPIIKQDNLRPRNFITCLLNRHYVRTGLKQTVLEVSKQTGDKYPGTVVNYLDACFPFIDKFPLFPHLSHNDGKKLDMAFCYNDVATGKASNGTPSPIGYGICEEPLPGEVNTSATCAGEGYHIYSMLRNIMPQGNKKNYVFDAARTAAIVNMFCAQPAVNKIFIEPHLKTRLGLSSSKIRFHGCQAVRHDDHFHVEIK